MINIDLNLQHFMLTHIFCILFFAFIYYCLFNDPEENFILNSSITKEEYLNNKIINSLYLSVNMQTTTGYLDFYVKSPIARLVSMVQLFLSLAITIGFIHYKFL